MTGGLEPLHDPLSPARRLMRILGPIVEPFVLAVLGREPQAPARCTVRTKLVGDWNTRGAGLLSDELAHQPLGDAHFTTALDRSIDYEVVLIDGASEPAFAAAGRNDDLIQVPLVVELGVRRRRVPAKSRPNFLAQYRRVS